MIAEVNIEKISLNVIAKIEESYLRFTSLKLKLVSAIFCQIFIFSSNDRPSKTMKNDFYFI